jgi:hypothetical protein
MTYQVFSSVLEVSNINDICHWHKKPPVVFGALYRKTPFVLSLRQEKALLPLIIFSPKDCGFFFITLHSYFV